jgi:hypothetical protein
MNSVSTLPFFFLISLASWRRLLTAGVMVIALTFLAGCTPEKFYAGPTDPMSKVVADINANNAKVPSLFAHHFFEADIVDDKHQNHHVSGDGVLLYVSPENMRLRGSTGLIGNVFDLGCNSQSYWLKLSPDTGDTMWWGTWANFAKLDPDATGIPIRPDMVLDVLGFTPINTDSRERSAATMLFNTRGDGSYVFVWVTKSRDRWFALREVWYDRVTKRPSLVQLYDTNGRVAMRVQFRDKDFRQVAVEGLPKEQWPYIPINYALIFPDSGSRLIFSLDEIMLKNQSGPTIIPNPKSFIGPDPGNVDVKKVYEIGPPPVLEIGPPTRNLTRPATQPTTEPRVQNGK